MLGVHNMGVTKVYKGHNTVEHAWNLQKFKHNPSVQDSDWRTYFKHNCKLIGDDKWILVRVYMRQKQKENSSPELRTYFQLSFQGFLTWIKNRMKEGNPVVKHQLHPYHSLLSSSARCDRWLCKPEVTDIWSWSMVALRTGSWLTSVMGESAERQAWRGFGAVGSGWKAALEFFSRYVYKWTSIVDMITTFTKIIKG